MLSFHSDMTTTPITRTLTRTLLASCLLVIAAATPAALRAQPVPPAALAEALSRPIITLSDKAGTGIGGNHDYISFAPDYWPDPTKPNGLPFVPRSGEQNFAQVARGDAQRLQTFIDTVDTLARAWRTGKNADAARRAVDWLRAWFVSPRTKMAPSLEYAHIRLGSNNNRGTPPGLIETRDLGKITAAVTALETSPALTETDKDAVRAWFDLYFDWLLVSKLGSTERAARNNHVTWFIAQALPIAIYLGRDNFARTLGEEAKRHIAPQIMHDGSQPEELRASNSLAQSVFNLEAYVRIARAAAPLGIDLWNYTAPNHASLAKAINFLAPYNQDPNRWPFPQQTALPPGFLNEILRERDSAMGQGQ
jgi:hypothetical protein